MISNLSAIVLFLTLNSSPALGNEIEKLSPLIEYEQTSTSLNILAFGDVMLSRNVASLIKEKGHDYLFEHLDLNTLQKGMDVVFANLEGPIHGQGTSGGSTMVFSFNQNVAPFLKEKGFNLLSLANNHALDQGWAGRDETIQVLEENDLDWCGHPSEADKDSVYYGKSATGMTYAFACFQDITHQIDLDAAKAMLKEVDPTVDTLIVSVHWGYEYKPTNNARQQELAHGFVDSGADFVIGHHPHVVENFEIYNGVPVFYSLGNFVFDQYWSVETQEELGIKIQITPKEYQIELLPMKSEKSQSRLMTEVEKATWVDQFLKDGTYDEAMQQMIRGFKVVVKR